MGKEGSAQGIAPEAALKPGVDPTAPLAIPIRFEPTRHASVRHRQAADTEHNRSRRRLLGMSEIGTGKRRGDFGKSDAAATSIAFDRKQEDDRPAAARSRILELALPGSGKAPDVLCGSINRHW
jgi:hypothetical protein